MNKKKYKDQCDICLKWDYCKGYQNKVICECCKRNQENKTVEIVGDADGQRKFNI